MWLLNRKLGIFINIVTSSFTLQLKEMVLALLDESDLDITIDAVEMIVDRVWKYSMHLEPKKRILSRDAESFYVGW